MAVVVKERERERKIVIGTQRNAYIGPIKKSSLFTPISNERAGKIEREITHDDDITITCPNTSEIENSTTHQFFPFQHGNEQQRRDQHWRKATHACLSQHGTEFPARGGSGLGSLMSHVLVL